MKKSNTEIRNNKISQVLLIVTYLAIFLQYPFGLAAGKLVFNINLFTTIQPGYLLLWGAIRLFVILPMIFALSFSSNDKGWAYFKIKDKNELFGIMFWGTLIFTILSLILYPQFIHQTKLVFSNLIYLFPLFSLYALSNAFVEEMFFRGTGLTFLNNKYPFWLANLIQAFFFALIHIINPMSKNILLFVALTFFLGLFWGWLTKKANSLLPAIILHVIADFFVAISLF